MSFRSSDELLLDSAKVTEASEAINLIRATHADLRIITIDELLSIVSEEHRKPLLAVFDLDPLVYDVRHTRIDIKEFDPGSLVAVDSQIYVHNGTERQLGKQYITPHFKDIFSDLTERMRADIGRVVLIQSGFRSPAYQAITFLQHLARTGSIDQTMRRVAPPNHSQHNNHTRLAVDLMRTDIGHADIDFDRSVEYHWLLANAAMLGISLSFPKDNGSNVDFEPWHWQQL